MRSLHTSSIPTRGNCLLLDPVTASKSFPREKTLSSTTLEFISTLYSLAFCISLNNYNFLQSRLLLPPAGACNRLKNIQLLFICAEETEQDAFYSPTRHRRYSLCRPSTRYMRTSAKRYATLPATRPRGIDAPLDLHNPHGVRSHSNFLRFDCFKLPYCSGNPESVDK
jgi:hypothetical protein